MDGMDLDSTWRSAECVTSLYDRVRELELRNAELEAEVMQWRDQSRQSRMTDASTSVDLGKVMRERDEWRDRFKQQDDISRRLQKRVDAMQEEHKEQVAKLLERCQFDPNGPKRVQVCVASLQKTLDGRVQQFESMQHRLRDTLDANAQLTSRNAALEQERASFVHTIAVQNAHRMYTLIQRRRKDILAASWTTWCVSTIRHSERQKREDSFQRLAALVKQSKKQLLQRQAARFTTQRAKFSRLRIFRAWASHAQAMTHARQIALGLFKESTQRSVADAFETWRERSARRASCSRVLEQLVRNHKQRHLLKGYRQWVLATRTQLIETIVFKCDVIEAEKSNVAAELSHVQTQLAAARAAQQAWEMAVRDMEVQQAATATHHAAIVNQWTTSLALAHLRMAHRRIHGLVFQAWKARFLHRRHVRALSAHWQAQQLRAVVMQWRHFRHRPPHAMRTAIQYMGHRRNGRRQRDVFLSWARRAHLIATQRRKLYRLRHQKCLTCLHSYWRQWREFVAQQIEHKTCVGRALEGLNEMLHQRALRRVFQSWESKVVALVQRDLRLKWVLEAAVGQSRTHLLCHVVGRWKRHAAVHKNRNVWLAFKTRQRHDRFQVWTQTVWRTWFAQCAVQIHRRSMLAVVVARWQSRWLRHGLWRWAANGRVAAFHDLYSQTVGQLNASIKALEDHLTHERERHRLDAAEMETAMRTSEAAFQVDLASQENEWTQKLEHVEGDFQRVVELKAMSDEAAVRLQNHIVVAQRRGEALEGMLMASEAQWALVVDAQRRDQCHRAMLEEDARSAFHRLATTLSHVRAAWDLEKQSHGEQLESLAKVQDEIKAKMGAKALECLMQRTTVYCFNRWKAFVASAKDMKGKVTHIVALLQSNQVALVFHRWQQYHQLHQAQKQLTAKWHAIHAKTLLTAAFTAWATNVAEKRKLSTILELVGAATDRKTYESVWRQWVHVTRHRRDAKRLWTRAIDLLTKQSYKVGLHQWKVATDAIASAKRAQFKIQALAHATNAVQRKWNNIVCRQVLVWWRENAHASRHDRDLLKRCATRLQHFAVGRVFEAWRENAYLQRRDRDARDLLLALWLRHFLRSTWARWRQFRLASTVVERRHLEELTRSTQQALLDAKARIESLTSHVESTQVAKAQLQDTTKQLKLQLQASKCMHFFQTTLRTAFFEWKRVAAEIKHTKGKALVIVRRMQRMHHAMVFDKWIAFVRRRRGKAERAAAAQSLRRKHTQLRALHAWAGYLRQTKALQQKCQWMAQMMASTSTRYVWKVWRVFQEHQRHACNKLVAVTTALESRAMRRHWQQWRGHHVALKFHDEAQRKKTQQVLLFLSARTASSLRYYFGGWRQFVARRHKKGSQDVLCKRWVCQNVWRRWRRAIDQDRQWRRVLHQFTRRILRQSWVQWQVGLVKLEVAWTKHSMEVEFVRQHDQWEVERAQLCRTAMELEEQAQQYQSVLKTKDDSLSAIQTNLEAVVASHRETDEKRAIYEDKLTTALSKTFDAMVLQRSFRNAWATWTNLRHQRAAAHARAMEWLQTKQLALVEMVFSEWKARLVPHRRRLRLQLKFKRRWLEGAVERWRLRTQTRLQVKTALRTVVVNMTRQRSQRLSLAWRQWLVHTMVETERAKQLVVEETYRRESAHEKMVLASTQKGAADMRTKWGMAMIVWRMRCAHLQKTAWGFQKWKHVAIQQAWRAKLQYTVGQLDAAHQLLLDEQGAVLAQREHVVAPLRSTWHALSQAKTLDQLFDAVAASWFPDTSGILYLVDPLKQELWSVVNRQVVTAPAHLGIAGHVVGSGAAFRTATVAQDTRFHPLVDQYVVNPIVTGAKSSSVVDQLEMVCVPIFSGDGVVWGVVQMAYLAHAAEVFIVCHACATAVEAVLHEMLKSSKDPIAARSPSKLTKLFKQHKQWRKYYLDVEIRLRQTQDLYSQLQGTHAQSQHDLQQLLLSERDAAEATMVRLRSRLAEKEIELQRQMEALEGQAGSDRREWKAKEDELRQVIWTLQNQQQLARARDMISSARHAPVEAPSRRDDADPTTHVLVAEIQGLKNQLARAETDALFLSKAIRVAIKYQGKLPDVMVAEVKRIGRRLSDKKTAVPSTE